MTEFDIKFAWADGKNDYTWVSEVGISNHSNRVDILGFSQLHLCSVIGVEIKTQTDTLKRLEDQAQAMSMLFDDCHLIVAPKHVKKAAEIIPSWWYLWVAEKDKIKSARPRDPRTTSPSNETLSAQLWKNELLVLLKEHGHLIKSSVHKSELCEKAGELPRHILLKAWLSSTHFQEAVKARAIGWMDANEATDKGSLFKQV
jgi:hypothetical protein